MSEVGFTRGPWYIGSKLIIGPRINSDGQDNGFISEVCDVSCGDGDRFANAYLISAAPELYESLEDLANIMDNDNRYYVQYSITKARAALAKARGE